MIHVPTIEDADLSTAVATAATTLRAGEPILLPTDTVYGLAALPGVPGATRRLFELKGRSADTPLAVLCADAEAALDLAEAPSKRVHRAAQRYWPGPLTLVLRRRAGLGYELGEPATTIGLRCPDHRLLQALAAEVGAIATTSANRHGEPTPLDAVGAARSLRGHVAVVLDGGICDNPPSTVVDATTVAWRILRQGGVVVDLA